MNCGTIIKLKKKTLTPTLTQQCMVSHDYENIRGGALSELVFGVRFIVGVGSAFLFTNGILRDGKTFSQLGYGEYTLLYF
jgi:hypothetical protein